MVSFRWALVDFLSMVESSTNIRRSKTFDSLPHFSSHLPAGLLVNTNTAKIRNDKAEGELKPAFIKEMADYKELSSADHLSFPGLILSLERDGGNFPPRFVILNT